MTQQGAGVTHTPNPQYDLVSVLYHALEGAQTYDIYIKDAEQGGDNCQRRFNFDRFRRHNVFNGRASLAGF